MAREYTENQRLEDKSRIKLKGSLGEWIVNEQYEDYGLDFEVRLTTETDGSRVATGTTFYIQLKASESFSGASQVGISLDTDLIEKQYLRSNVPTVLALYDESKNELYWQIIESYCWDYLDDKNPDWRKQTTVKIKMPRRPLETSISELEENILSTERRIVLKHSNDLDISEGVPKSAGPNELEKIRNDLYRQYQRKTLIQGQKYLQDSKKDRAIQRFLQVIKSPVDDESSLQAGLELLSHKQYTNDLESSVQKAYVLSRALRLASQYNHERLTELVEESKSMMPYLRSQLVGSRYNNTDIGENFSIVALENWVPSSEGMMLVAIQQYDDGVPFDENALAIIQNENYCPLPETGPTLRGVCDDGNHQFPKENLRYDTPPAFCEKCGLSDSVVMEFVDHDPPFVCEICDEIKPFMEFTEGYICESCQSEDNGKIP